MIWRSVLHEAFYVARSGGLGPLLSIFPKDVQFATGNYVGPSNIQHKTYKPHAERRATAGSEKQST